MNEALSVLPEGYSTIALISDLYKAKQQITWYKMGEAMLKGKVSEVQDLVVEYKRMKIAEDRQRQRLWGSVQKLIMMRKFKKLWKKIRTSKTS